ncbi:bifunctional DNA-formamidopyrimidine glycosylase/DNA-(apurinic or apyrimidinic site) lyase [Rhodoluna sp.]|jgi:formamidopyrimidine-DNA glycosylase|uniref:bifunctional DNA-formamidopyrimidine glycosylase/DNA-(apurinic or apyrimidinic site) lyase n=1 Tax=Rhodoluna sp. TaxID=1969481 RepID=UPI0025F7E24B|nr:bifunctional DNA-formamidopyrimidine glycosylase/DNA-(apurinic or apyrimidinic site) lyase [Rhodoluna sp.]
MPELPEVETVRAGLAPALTNAKVTGVDVLDARSLKRHPGGVEDFKQTLIGAKILGVVRRGKFLWLPIEVKGTTQKLALVGHLGMSGQMLLRSPGASEDKLTRVVIHAKCADGEKVEFRFIDQRIFGSLAIDELIETSDGKPGGFSAGVGLGQYWQNMIPRQAAHITRDPLDEDFDEPAVLAKFKKKNSGIKRVLLDQQTLSGIGNIYADEALWQAKLHYDQPAASISKAKASELLAAVKDILAKAVAQGGTSFDEQYKNVNGESGYFAVSLNAYGMTGLPCKRCGHPIKRENWMNRGSHLCPKCQRRRG